MRRLWILGVVAVLAGAVSGCAGSAKPTAGPAPAATVPAATASAGGSAGPTSASPAAGATGAVTTDIDPCQLVTQQEATALAGGPFGAGREEGDPGGERRCVYGYQTKNVLLIAVIRAPSVDVARTEKDKLRAEAEQQFGGSVTMTALSGLGDDAEFMGASQMGISIAGIYVLRGTIGFAVVDAVAGHAAPSRAALTGQATTVLGRLPA